MAATSESAKRGNGITPARKIVIILAVLTGLALSFWGPDGWWWVRVALAVVVLAMLFVPGRRGMPTSEAPRES